MHLRPHGDFARTLAMRPSFQVAAAAVMPRQQKRITSVGAQSQRGEVPVFFFCFFLLCVDFRLFRTHDASQRSAALVSGSKRTRDGKQVVSAPSERERGRGRHCVVYSTEPFSPRTTSLLWNSRIKFLTMQDTMSVYSAFHNQRQEPTCSFGKANIEVHT